MKADLRLPLARGEILRLWGRRRTLAAALLAGLSIAVLYTLLAHQDLADIRARSAIAAQPIDFEALEAQGRNLSEDNRLTMEEDRLDELAHLVALEADTEGGLSIWGVTPRLAAFLGSLPGVVLAILLASSLFGAEYRWRYWGVLAVQQPARWKTFLVKVVALGLLLALWLLFSLAMGLLASSIGAVFHSHPVAAAPAFSRSLGALLSAWVALTTFGVIAAAAVTVTRSTLVGVSTPVVLIGLEILATTLFVGTRRLLPAQQVAWLLPGDEGASFTVAPLWLPRIESVLTSAEAAFGGVIRVMEPLSPISPAAAAGLLCAWIGLSISIAIGSLSYRDMPG